jgi:hypothetical protein
MQRAPLEAVLRAALDLHLSVFGLTATLATARAATAITTMNTMNTMNTSKLESTKKKWADMSDSED